MLGNRGERRPGSDCCGIGWGERDSKKTWTQLLHELHSLGIHESDEY